MKSLSSLEEKLERKSLEINSISDLHDLIGVRTILLFRQDLEKVGNVLRETFNILSVEDAGARLSEVQFGYQSQHYIVEFKPDWLKIPTFSGFSGLKAEIQVRTLAQHIWAAASHKLQYKQEQSVPPPLRRTIHRVSALLETVDLELERVLNERKSYISEATETPKPSETLNVDLIKEILKEFYPDENSTGSENYAELLEELFKLNITTSSDLREVVEKNLGASMDGEKKAVQAAKEGGRYRTTAERLSRGVFYSHVGLARQALKAAFGGRYRKVLSHRTQTRTKLRRRAVKNPRASKTS